MAYKKVVNQESAIFYLKNVLGLNRVVWPKNAVAEGAAFETQNEVVSLGTGRRVVFIGPCTSPAELELFQKIVGAMKLKMEDIRFFQTPPGFQDIAQLQEQVASLQPEQVVVLGEDAFFIPKTSQIPSLAQMLISQEHKKTAWKILQNLLALVLFFFVNTTQAAEASRCVVQMDLTSAVGPATLDLLERSLAKVKEQQCGALLLRINTPGGSLQTTRLIIEKIVNSPVPVLCLVAPSGGHAGSAGAIILQACHINGALEATNIGAATPVTLGEEMGKDLRNKVVNDTVSMMEGLAELRGRSKQFARDIVEKATAVSANEAHKIRAIDFVGQRQEDFLKFVDTKFADPKKIPLKEGLTAEPMSIGEIIIFPQDLRFKFLDLVTHPQVAYLIFMGSLALLYFEITHAGMIAPGVIGALGLITSLMSFHMLEVRWGGLALLILGLGLMIAEIFVTSFGALGIGGLVAFVAGSLLLFDPTVAVLPLAMILPTALGLGFLMLLVGSLALRAQRSRVANRGMVGEVGKVTRLADDAARTGTLECRGEIWNFESTSPLQIGDEAIVFEMNGLTLKVKRREN
ncbi:MAG: nodulation protein NfeD [Bdellovibrionales bacterium]